MGDDPYGEDGRESTQHVSHGTDTIWLKRNRDYIIRERFARVLRDAQERRVKQTGDDTSVTRLAASETYLVPRVPHTFVGCYGFVSDGPPEDVPAGVEVISR